ncbi:MAG TPA: hypothetical protein VNU68_20735 [Verrucomicrobiae bacterium]|jgi:hypothetical protein|nr:hypothetical protein [Verrucomicrobiae bacterium]
MSGPTRKRLLIALMLVLVLGLVALAVTRKTTQSGPPVIATFVGYEDGGSMPVLDLLPRPSAHLLCMSFES